MYALHILTLKDPHMNRPVWYSAMAGLLSILVLSPAFAAESATPTQHHRALDTYRTEYVRSFLDEQVDPIVRRYLDNVRLMPPYHGSVFGRNDARSYHSAFFERFDVRDYRRDQLRTFDLGSRLIEIGRFTMKLVASGGTEVSEIAGNYMDIWETVPGKPLGLMAHAWNSNRYPEIANDLRFTDVPSVRTAFQAHVPVKDNLSFELAALNELHEVAVSEHDDKVWSQFFANDAVLLANHHGYVEGRGAIETYLAQHVKEMPVFEKLDIRNDEIDATGRYVIEYASHVANWRNAESSGVNTGKNIRVWRRESDGSLKVICGIGTYD